MAKIASNRIDIRDILIEDDKLLHVVYLLIASLAAVFTVIMFSRADSLIIICLSDLIVGVFGVIWTGFIVLFHIHQEKRKSSFLIQGPYQGMVIDYLMKSIGLTVVVELLLYYSFLRVNGGAEWISLVISGIAFVWVGFFVFIGLHVIKQDISLHYSNR